MCMLAANPFAFSPAEYALIALVAGGTTTAIAAWGNRVKTAFSRARAGAGAAAGQELAAA
jgi:hypothetical protein